MITGLIHRNYYISVSTNNESRELMPKVNISSQDGKPMAFLGTSRAFATEAEAELCGVEMGKEWIDRNLRLGK